MATSPDLDPSATSTNDTISKKDPEDEKEWVNDEFLSFDNPRKRPAEDTAFYDSMEDDAEGIEDETEYEAQQRRNRNPPWMKRNNRRVFPLTALHNEIVSFVELMEPLPKEIEQRETLIKELRATVAEVFGDTAEMQVFGSQSTGLYLPTSDIDIVVKSLVPPSEDEYSSSPLHQFAAAMSAPAWRSRLSYFETLTKARIPLVKFTVAATDISVDVSFDSPGGVAAADLMRQFLSALPALRPLTIVLKYFLAARDLNAPYTGGVGAYMLQLMIISFLQQRERELLHTRRVYNLGALLLDFLERYGVDLNFFTTGISVRYDGFYFPKAGDVFSPPGKPALLAVENPLDPTTLNVGLSSFRYGVVQRAFVAAYKVLLSMVSPGEGYGNEGNSILVSILPVSPYMTGRMVMRRRDKALSSKRRKT